MNEITKFSELPLTEGCKFFCYDQNNSGGRFIIDELSAHDVFVEAHDSDEADRLAEENTGVYFDGCTQGFDCDCCGDRWSKSWSDEGTDVPSKYGTSILEIDASVYNRTAIVFFLNGDRLYCLYTDKGQDNKFILIKSGHKIPAGFLEG